MDQEALQIGGQSKDSGKGLESMLSKVQRYVHSGGALVGTEALGSLLDGTHGGFPHERQHKQYLIPLDAH